MYHFLLGEIHAHTRRAGAHTYRTTGLHACIRANPVTVSRTGPMYDSRGWRWRNGNEVSEEPEDKVAGDLRGVNASMSETRKRTERMRSKDTRMSVAKRSGEPLSLPVVLTQVHQDTGDLVTNSPAFCPIPTTVLLTHYKARRATRHAECHLNQLSSENMERI